MRKAKLNRRDFVKMSASAGIVGTLGVQHGPVNANSNSDEFEFAVDFPDSQWRAMFSDEVYRILRQGGTERPKSSKWWNDYRAGKFSCIGCGLKNYESVWRVEIDRGWVFFSQSVPNAILMGIDGVAPDGMADDKTAPATIEVHCRRCGSHMGHLLKVEGQVVHCINGKSLNFVAA